VVTERIADKAAKALQKGKATLAKLVVDMQEMKDKAYAINEIAAKTDILAINAAVEAARAGNSGKGFAIVASEVRSLSIISKNAADTIDELVKDNTQNIVSFNNQLEDIVSDVNKTAALLKEISFTSQEQNSGVNQISTAIQQFNSTIQANSATAEELSASSSELKNQAKYLFNAVNFFILTEKDVNDKISKIEGYVKNLLETLETLKQNESIQDTIERKPNQNKEKIDHDNMESNKGINLNIEDDFENFD